MLYLSDFKNNNKIKGIQRGITSFSTPLANVSISAVNLEKTELRALGMSSINNGTDCRVYFLDSSTIQFSKVTSGTVYASWELTEWE